MENLLVLNNDTQMVSARELHNLLGVEKRFSAWFETNSQGFIENEDYTSVLKSTEVQNNGGIQIRELQDFNISMDMAKHICLMSRTDKGKQCRQYLIELEKAWNTPEMVMARGLQASQRIIEMQEERIKLLQSDIEVMKPKVDFFDTVADSKTAISMNEVAKVIGINGMGRNNLFEFLRENGILQRNNVPYQRFVDSGWFRVIEQSYQRNGEPVVTTKTLVYQKGVDGIRQLLEKKGIS